MKPPADPDAAPTGGAGCPAPLSHERVQIGHGGGGRLTSELVERIFRPAFAEASPREPLHDAALFDAPRGPLAFSTDAYVVSPLFFPGGDIGRLAVFGTVNDLAMAGARALALSAAFILEEGLPLEVLQRIAQSMGEAARAAGVRIAAGDTKVVERGRADGLYITTSGVGTQVLPSSPTAIAAGDCILVSGDLGRHGFAVLARRHELNLESPIESDCADLSQAALALAGEPQLHCLRDLTRGGLATALCELSSAAGLDFELRESLIPVSEPVQGVSELLGIDPLYVANEGRFVAFVPEARVGPALDALRAHPVARGARAIGRVLPRSGSVPRVVVESVVGGRRLLWPASGEQLPRIC